MYCSSRGRGESNAMARRTSIMEGLWVLGVVVLWIVLNRWVLPQMGVPT